MTVVYIDDLFLLNAVVDYFLLLTSARLSGERISRLRMALGAIFGGLYAVLVFFPSFGWLSHPLCKIAMAALLVLISFGSSKRILRVTLIFIGVSAAFAGTLLAIQLLGGRNFFENSVLYAKLDFKLILLLAIACYAILTLIGSRIVRHSAGREIVPATFQLFDRTVSLSALIDTGNTLTDPLNNAPVMVVAGDYLEGILPEGINLNAPVETMERMSESGLGKQFRLLSYRAVGVDCGLLLAVRADSAVVNGKKLGHILIALSPNPVSDGGGYQGLIGDLGGAA